MLVWRGRQGRRRDKGRRMRKEWVWGDWKNRVWVRVGLGLIVMSLVMRFLVYIWFYIGEEIKIQSCFFMSSIANYHMRKYWKKIHKYAYTKNIQTTSIHRIINTVNRFHKARTLTLLKSYKTPLPVLATLPGLQPSPSPHPPVCTLNTK